MAKFFDPPALDDSQPDHRLHAPATARNKEAILDVLRDHLTLAGTLLELASGTGEHACHFAAGLPHLSWQPTDIDPSHLNSIHAWGQSAGLDNLHPPMHLDATEKWPEIDDLVAVNAVNLIHISPLIVTNHVIEKSGDHLPAGGILYFYGPFKRGGQHTAQSNVDFDASLQSRNPDWGVRDMEYVIDKTARAGFGDPVITPMPANNFSLIFKRL